MTNDISTNFRRSEIGFQWGPVKMLAVFSAIFVFALAMSFAALAQNAAKPAKKKSQNIVVLVNDEPITNYQIKKRQNLLGLGNKKIASTAQANFKRLLKQSSVETDLKAILKKVIDANQGKSRDEIIAIFNKRKKAYGKRLQQRAISSARNSVLAGLRNKALNELIDERLQLQEAKRLNVLASKEEVDKAINDMASRNQTNMKSFAAQLRRIGSDIYSMRDRMKASLSWRNVVRRQFGRHSQLSSRDIDRWTDGIGTSASASADANTSLKLQRITFALTGPAQEAQFARLLQQADALRQRHTGCRETPTLAKSVSGARFEDLGLRPVGSIAEPTRSMLLNANPGEMLPANVGSSGVELWVLCEKKASNAGSGPSVGGSSRNSRTDARMREFQLLSKRHLKDLRQDAHIEYR